MSDRAKWVIGWTVLGAIVGLAGGESTALPLPTWTYVVVAAASFAFAAWSVYRISRVWLRILAGLAVAWVLTTALLTVAKIVAFYDTL